MSRPIATLRLRSPSGPVEAQVHLPPGTHARRLVVAFVDPAMGEELCSTSSSIVISMCPTSEVDPQPLLAWIAVHAAELGACADAIAVAGVGVGATKAHQMVALAVLAGWPRLHILDHPHQRRNEMDTFTTTATDDEVRQLAETAKPYTLALLWWGPERHQDDADATEREHQRRMVSLRAAGVIAILGPVGSDTLAGVALMTVPAEEATKILDDDPCVRSGMMRREIHPCHGFPGDAVPAGSVS